MSAPAGAFRVVLVATARADLKRLLRHALSQAHYAEDVARARAAIVALREQITQRLSQTPYLYRIAADGTALHELVVPGPGGGYVALYDITSASQVTVIAVRHQLEDDYL